MNSFSYQYSVQMKQNGSSQQLIVPYNVSYKLKMSRVRTLVFPFCHELIFLWEKSYVLFLICTFQRGTFPSIDYQSVTKLTKDNNAGLLDSTG